MVACAAKNNSRGKKMRTIDEDTALAPDNPIEEGIGMMQLHKGGVMSHGETLATVSEVLISKKEITGTRHEAGNSADLKSDMSSPWWIGMAGTEAQCLPYRNKQR